MLGLDCPPAAYYGFQNVSVSSFGKTGFRHRRNHVLLNAHGWRPTPSERVPLLKGGPGPRRTPAKNGTFMGGNPDALHLHLLIFELLDGAVDPVDPVDPVNLVSPVPEKTCRIRYGHVLLFVLLGVTQSTLEWNPCTHKPTNGHLQLRRQLELPFLLRPDASSRRCVRRGERQILITFWIWIKVLQLHKLCKARRDGRRREMDGANLPERAWFELGLVSLQARSIQKFGQDIEGFCLGEGKWFLGI